MAKASTTARSEAAPSAPGASEAPRIVPAPRPPRAMRARAYAILALSAVLMFLGFAGFGVWPLAFVGLVPALFVFDPTQTAGGFDRPGGKVLFRRALFFGYLSELGGFYWITNTLTDFSGFPVIVCLLFSSIFYLFQGLQFVAVLWLFARARARGAAATPAALAAYLATEQLFPMLFEHYYGNTFVHAPILAQVAELGGPMMCTAIAIGGAGAIYEVAAARLARLPIPRLWPSLALGYLLFALGFGAWRMADVEAAMAQQPTMRVALVQTNMGLFEKWENPREGLRRHVTQTHEAEAAAEPPDLVVWPESAVTYFLDDVRNVRRSLLPGVHTPVMFGALRHGVGEGGRDLDHNTAFLADANGDLIGHYDKQYLLAFGEFLPFGDVFPWLYDASPMSGRFSPGADIGPIAFEHQGHSYRLQTLICYEDIVSAYVRSRVRADDPHLLVNVTNDSWFGDTQEPWVHLYLAQFRAIEHRRWLLRATNSGVSAIIDPTGRVIEGSPVFERDNVEGEVGLMHGWTTLYQLLGAWPGWLSVVVIAWLGLVRKPAPKMV